MLAGNKRRTSSSFGPDGRRLDGSSKRKILKTVPRKSLCGSSSLASRSNNKLFQSGVKLSVKRAPILNCLSVPMGVGINKKFQRPVIKRRAYDKNTDLALKRSSLGQRKRMDGMAKLLARAGKGLMFKLPQQRRASDGDTDNSDDSDDEEDEKENDKPFEPLLVWTSPHQGGEAIGLPPTIVTEMQPDEYGVEEAVQVLRPAPDTAYMKENVFVPPVLAKWLRPHQREGVHFMYQCVMGLQGYNGNGCILADDMGLGKTLQSVTLIYTLLKTGITANREPTAKRVIVVCPCSLVKNWENEFIKWLGPGVVKALALAEADRKTVEKNIDLFVRTKMFNVLIASYECIRTHVKRLTVSKECCDLLVCDEAHRLKNNESQTTKALASLPVKRRVLLTGTPMQNDLEEFFAMVDFTNPGILGTQEEFRKKMLYPVLRGREPDATDAQKQKMMQIQNDMSSTVNAFILRRTNTLNAKHLPPKLVQVVCCNLTDIQKNMYEHLVNSKALAHVLKGKQENCLGSIQMLMKLCNHPSLIVNSEPSNNGSGRRAAAKTTSYAEDAPGAAVSGAEDISKFLPFDAAGGGRGSHAPVRPEWSGKMFVLYRLMKEMRKPGNGNDKIVIVSNYTQTLDLIGKMCRDNSWGFCRLDGSITMKKRQKMVEEFNDPSSSLVAFLLSSKAGGCGLNLIGGNRLVLFDPDWNPAVDKQAAARCWRDGNKKRCFTYRFLATGTVEEKIFQRQLSKEGLQSIVDDKEQVNALSTKDLKNLFKLRSGTPSDTHDKLRCERCKIIADTEAAEALKVLPKKLEACKSLLGRMMEHEDASIFLAPLKPEEHGVTVVEYEKLVRQPIDMSAIRKRIDLPAEQASAYKSVSEFSKDVNKIFSNVCKVWSPGQEIADASRRLQSWWVGEWTELVPMLMGMKADEEKKPAAATEEMMNCEAAIHNERSDDFQEQIGMPAEEAMRQWSHHYTTDTVDDPVFRAAMRGYDSVSFVFGLETTRSLIEQKEQEEEEREALEALQRLQDEGDDPLDNCKGDDDDDEIKDSEMKEESAQGDAEDETNSNCAPGREESEQNDPAINTEGEEEEEDDDDDDEEWTLSRVFRAEEIVSGIHCASEGCQKRACSMWKSSKGEEWSGCFDCQNEEFGPWPAGTEPAPDLLSVITTHCSGASDEGVMDIKDGVNHKSDSNDSLATETEDEEVSPKSGSSSDTISCSESSQSSSVSPPSNSSEWACIQCTLINPKSARKCKVCGTKKPKQK